MKQKADFPTQTNATVASLKTAVSASKPMKIYALFRVKFITAIVYVFLLNYLAENSLCRKNLKMIQIIKGAVEESFHKKR